MADAAEGSADSQVSFKVKTSGDKTHTITMNESASVLDLKTKLAGEDFENIPVDRQRLIYSGRVMKNDEPLSTYKIKAGNTVHLVKSAASNPTPAQPASSSVPAAPQVPTNMAAGTANNPLAGLTGARYAGMTNLPSADMFGPDGGMVGSMMDEESMANMLNNPMVAQQMNEILNNDQFLDMMIQQTPMLRNNPNAREMLRSPLFRQMMTNPEALRSAARFRRMMGGAQGGANAFPAPGVTDNTPADGANADGNREGGNTGAANPFNPFDPSAMWGNMPGAAGGNGAAANPFAALFNPFGMAPPAQGAGANTTTNAATPGTQTESTGNANSTATTEQTTGTDTTTTNPSSPPPNPFASLFGAPGAGGANPWGNMPQLTPEQLQSIMGMMNAGSPGASPAPADNRPPEERYAEQLRQLNDMGFFDFDRNVEALRRSGGSVQGAIEHLLNS